MGSTGKAGCQFGLGPQGAHLTGLASDHDDTLLTRMSFGCPAGIPIRNIWQKDIEVTFPYFWGRVEGDKRVKLREMQEELSHCRLREAANTWPVLPCYLERVLSNRQELWRGDNKGVS